MKKRMPHCICLHVAQLMLFGQPTIYILKMTQLHPISMVSLFTDLRLNCNNLNIVHCIVVCIQMYMTCSIHSNLYTLRVEVAQLICHLDNKHIIIDIVNDSNTLYSG